MYDDIKALLERIATALETIAQAQIDRLEDSRVLVQEARQASLQLAQSIDPRIKKPAAAPVLTLVPQHPSTEDDLDVEMTKLHHQIFGRDADADDLEAMDVIHDAYEVRFQERAKAGTLRYNPCGLDALMLQMTRHVARNGVKASEMNEPMTRGMYLP